MKNCVKSQNIFSKKKEKQWLVPCYKAAKDFNKFVRSGGVFITKFDFFISHIFFALTLGGAFHCNCVFKNRTLGCLRRHKIPKISAFSFNHANLEPPLLFYEMRF